MLEFTIPSTVYGSTDVLIHGIKEVPAGYEDEGIGNVLSFQGYVGDQGITDLGPYPTFSLSGILIGGGPSYTISATIDAGDKTAVRSFYLVYVSAESFGTAGVTTSILNVNLADAVLPNNPRPNIAYRKAASRGAFL